MDEVSDAAERFTELFRAVYLTLVSSQARRHPE